VHCMPHEFDAQTLFYIACKQHLWAFVQVLAEEASEIDITAAVPGHHSQRAVCCC